MQQQDGNPGRLMPIKYMGPSCYEAYYWSDGFVRGKVLLSVGCARRQVDPHRLSFVVNEGVDAFPLVGKEYGEDVEIVLACAGDLLRPLRAKEAIRSRAIQDDMHRVAGESIGLKRQPARKICRRVNDVLLAGLPIEPKVERIGGAHCASAQLRGLHCARRHNQKSDALRRE